LMLNARGAPPESSGMAVAGRTLSFSRDGGATWTKPQPDTSGIPNYIETHSGLLRVSTAAGPRLLYSFPHSVPAPEQKRLSSARANGTILLSEDDGRSWPIRKLLVPGSFGYSNMDALPDGKVAIVYENAGGTTVSVSRFTLEWLTDGKLKTASAGTPSFSAASAVAEVSAIDRRRLTALQQLDHGVLKEIFADDCVYVHGSGRIDTRDQYLARLANGELRYLAINYDHAPVVRSIGSDGAVVTGQVSLTSQGKAGGPNQRVLTTTSVYSRRGGRWQLVSYQATPLAVP
jgi:ketosteroid isomerase-like protein